jgi:hypothetical protein
MPVCAVNLEWRPLCDCLGGEAERSIVLSSLARMRAESSAMVMVID